MSKRIVSTVSTMLTGLLSAGFVALGAVTIDNGAETNHGSVAARPPHVAAVPARQAVSYEVERTFVGQIEAAQRTDLGFELSGTLVEIIVEEGQRIAKGDIIARLDTRGFDNQKRTQQAARRALDARAELARLTKERRVTLEKKGFATKQAYDQARLELAEIEARIGEIDASIEGIDIQLDKSVLRAPYGGQIGARHVDPGASIAAGQPVATLLQDAAPRLRVGVPPSLANKVAIGSDVEIDVAGTPYPGRISHLRPDLDPATRTRTLVVTIEAGDRGGSVLFGQTGRLHLTETVREPGTWVPLTALHAGIRGLWSVFVLHPIDHANAAVVRSEAVEIIHANEQRAFVRGTLPSETMVVADGTHTVVAGQTVRFAKED